MQEYLIAMTSFDILFGSILRSLFLQTQMRRFQLFQANLFQK